MMTLLLLLRQELSSIGVCH